MMPSDSLNCTGDTEEGAPAERQLLMPVSSPSPLWLRSKRIVRGISAVVLGIFVVVVGTAGGLGAIHFFDGLKFADFEPAAGTRLAQANRYRDMHPELFWQTPLYLTLRAAVPGQSLLEPSTRVDEVSEVVRRLVAAATIAGEGSGLLLRLRSYFTPGYQNYTFIGGTNNDTTLIVVGYAGSKWPSSVNAAIQRELRDVMQSYGNRYEVTLTGIPALNSAMVAGVLPNIAAIDAVAIPIALALFAVASRTIIPLIIPVVVMCFGVVTTLAWGELLKQRMPVTGFAPELMGAVVIGLSIDFSLFFVTRLREVHSRHRHGMMPAEVVYMTYRQVSHNVIVSGLSVAAAFGGLATIDVDFVRSIALLCMTGTLMTLLGSLSLTPALLFLLYPSCFDSTVLGYLFRRCKSAPSASSYETLQEEETEDAPRRMTHSVHVYHQDEPLTLWGRIALLSVRRPLLVLAAASLIVAFPLYALITQFAYDDSVFSSSPHSTAFWWDYADVVSTFGSQADTPITVFVTTTGPSMTNTTWALFDEIVDAAVESELSIDLDHIDAPNIFRGRRITFAECLEMATDESANVYTEQLQFLTPSPRTTGPSSPLSSSMVAIRLKLPGPQWGSAGCTDLSVVRRFINERVAPLARRMPTVEFVGFEGANSDSWWVMRRVMAQFRTEMFITAGTLSLALLVLFRSVFFAVKMLITMAYTVVFSFGLGVAVFHHTSLPVFAPALRHVDNIFWLIIVIAFSVVCVLSLDYDVFLIVRILEFRQVHCFDDLHSVVHAVSRSGPVISYAALIMMVSFGALMAANTLMLAQFGLILSAAVLIDAFVVRPFIVPALIGLMPSSRAVWFPRRMPYPSVSPKAPE